MSNLTTRILTASAALPILGVFILLGGLPFLGLVCVVTALGVHEYYQLASVQIGHRLNTAEKAFGIIAGLLFPAAAYVSPGNSMPPLVAVTIAGGLVLRLWAPRCTHQPIPIVSSLVLGPLYVGFLLSHAILMREGPGHGTFFLFLSVACTMLSDTGAYAGGRALGRHPLAPRVSPKKTLEGGIAGILTGPLSALLVVETARSGGADIRLGTGQALFLGLLIGIASMVGDLTESLLKRGSGIKDSGTLFPGHGGVLDRLDSLLFSIPLTYYYVLFASGI